MKVKIKDLTLEDLLKYCNQHKSCKDCFLFDDVCDMGFVNFNFANPEKYNEEVEVPDNAKK